MAYTYDFDSMSTKFVFVDNFMMWFNHVVDIGSVTWVLSIIVTCNATMAVAAALSPCKGWSLKVPCDPTMILQYSDWLLAEHHLYSCKLNEYNIHIIIITYQGGLKVEERIQSFFFTLQFVCSWQYSSIIFAWFNLEPMIFTAIEVDSYTSLSFTPTPRVNPLADKKLWPLTRSIIDHEMRTE